MPFTLPTLLGHWKGSRDTDTLHTWLAVAAAPGRADIPRPKEDGHGPVPS
jgi:hypothetical protein